MQSPRTLREAETKKGRCSVFRQRPFDVFATTGCCRGCCDLRFNPRCRAAFSGSAGKNRKSPSITRFSATKPQVAEAQNRGLVGRSRFYPALPELPHGSMRQIPEPTSTPPFSHRETAGKGVAASRCARQVLNLPHTSGFCLCDRPCSCKTSAR